MRFVKPGTYTGSIIPKEQKMQKKPIRHGRTLYDPEAVKIIRDNWFQIHPYEEGGVMCGYDLESYTDQGFTMHHIVDMSDFDEINPENVVRALKQMGESFDAEDYIRRLDLDESYEEEFDRYDRRFRDMLSRLVAYMEGKENEGGCGYAHS